MEDRSLEILGTDSSQGDIVAALDSLKNHTTLGLDFESDAFHSYAPSVCVVQISDPDRDYVIDLLAVGMTDDLRALLTDPERTWILHGADFDVLSLRREFDLVLGGIFDTMIASRFLGDSVLGLAGVVEQALGIPMSKGQQRSDWRRRPLTPEQIKYARADTMHLLSLQAHLVARLEAEGRLSWLEEECEMLRHRQPVEKPFDQEGWLKLKGVRDMSEDARRAVRSAFLWREQVAERANRAPFRVIGTDGLLAIGRAIEEKGAEGIAHLDRLRGIPKRMNHGSLLRAVRAGLADRSPVPTRRAPRSDRHDRKRAPMSVEVKARLERLKVVREEGAKRLNLDPGFLMPISILDALARQPPTDAEALESIDGMTRWRAEALGKEIREVL